MRHCLDKWDTSAEGHKGTQVQSGPKFGSDLLMSKLCNGVGTYIAVTHWPSPSFQSLS